MSKIHILPHEIVSKIAAGEVIERPASVVKELIENALDADTSSIELHLKQAGKTLIRMKDTGTGIEPQDLKNVFIRHSTSKINTAEDLYKIQTLGFRGEALYSIAAISDVTLRSKTKSNDSGWQIHCRGNTKLSLEPVPLAYGTEIEVKELFFNTPARKKFLSSDSSELRRILNTFIPYTLLYPKIRFFLTHNEKTILDLIPAENHTLRIAQSLNLEEKHLLSAKQRYTDDIDIALILGDINIQRPNRDLQFIYINNRPVQSRSLSFNINQAYRIIFPQEAKPFFAVYINIRPENLDVNIHPTKREVKLKSEYHVISLLRYLCEETLKNYGKAKQINETFLKKNPNLIEYPQEPAPYSLGIKDNVSSEYQTSFTQSRLPAQEQSFFTPQKNSLNGLLQEAVFIGTFQRKYLLFETNHSILVIDQHAAHERITYEKLKQQLDTAVIEKQNLLIPVLIGLNTQEMLIWQETKDSLEKIGFSTTLWDNSTIAVHSHPQLLDKPEAAVRNIISGENSERCDIDVLVRRACRSSIMTGDRITKEEAEFLKERLLKCSSAFTCPHGRPTVIEIQENMLTKQFLR